MTAKGTKSKAANTASKKKGKRAARMPRSQNNAVSTALSRNGPTITINPENQKILECVKNHIDGVFDPFNCKGFPCNYGTGADPNFPIRQHAKIFISVSTGQEGCILINPNASNDENFIYWTDGTNTTTVSTIKTGNTAKLTGSPFTASSFSGDKLSQRCLMGGVRVTNVSASLYKQGMMRSYMHYDEGYFNLTDSFSTFQTNARVLYGQNVLYQPWVKFDAADSDNFNAATTYHGNTNGDMILHLPGAASGAAQYFLEAVFFYEVRGPAVQSLVRSAPSSPDVYTKVKTEMENIIKDLGGKVPGVSQLAGMAMGKLKPFLSQHLVDIGQKQFEAVAETMLNAGLRAIV